MTQPTNDELTKLAREMVTAAAGENVALRVLGGAAVHMTCPSIETHPTLQRPLQDLDFVATRPDFEAAGRLFATHGATLRSHDATRWVFDYSGSSIDLTVPDFRHNHRIDLGPRLGLASPTLPAADLLLIKLQRKMAEKDIQDAVALLLDHRAAPDDEEDHINHEYIARLCAHDWGLFTAAYDNTVMLEQVLDKYLDSEEAQLVWRRIESIQEDMDRQPKSLGWMLNQIVRHPSQVPA